MSTIHIIYSISLNLLIFRSVNLNDEENKAVFKSVQTFIIKSKRFTPWHAHIIFFTFSILFNLFVLIFLSKLCSFQLHAYIHFCSFFPHCINNSYKFKILISMHIYIYIYIFLWYLYILHRKQIKKKQKSICLFLNPIV